MQTFELKIILKQFLSPKETLNLINNSFLDTFLSLLKENFITTPYLTSMIVFFLFLLAMGIWSKKRVGKKKVRLITEGTFQLILFLSLIIPTLVFMLYILLLMWLG